MLVRMRLQICCAICLRRDEGWRQPDSCESMQCYTKGNEIDASTENNPQDHVGAAHRQQFLTHKILSPRKRGVLYQQLHLEGETVGVIRKRRFGCLLPRPGQERQHTLSHL